MEYYGYAGKILYVDLTTGKARTEPLDMEMAKKYIGGCGIGARLLYDILKPGTDPLGPDNPMILSAGTLTGTLAPSSSKMQLLTKSATPAGKGQSKYYVPIASAGSSRFAVMMKNAGYDQIVITGRASKPVYLRIEDDDVEICDAGDMWGKMDVYETSDELMRRHKDCGVITIGRSGENMTVFALASIDKRNTIGRNGGAVVMGSKNLKAIVVHGTKGVKMREPEKFLSLADSIAAEAVKHKPFLSAIFPALKLPPNALPPNVELTETRACANCPTACRTVYTVKSGEFAGTELRSGNWAFIPRYSQYMELKNSLQTLKLLELFNNAGICFVTALGMIKFVTALYEDGVIGKTETDGLELKMGDFDSYLKLAEKLINREGIGDTMARGWQALSERVGADEEAYKNSRGVIKGTSVIAGAESRRLGFMFATIVNPRGGMHLHPITSFLNRSMDEFRDWGRGLAMSEEDIARIIHGDDFNCGRFTKHYEDGESIYWALGICVFGVRLRYQNLRLLADLYSSATGVQIAPTELKKTGERIWNLYKMLNVREGFTREDDKIPGLWAKSLENPIEDYVLGKLQLTDYFGRPVTLAGIEQMLNEYYDEHGWDIKTGIPTRKKLTELDLEELG